jgi:radical SAM/Cys-rich protein
MRSDERQKHQDIRDRVREYYGNTLQSSDDLKTDACCCTTQVPPKYVLDVIDEIDDEILTHFYGCGSPIPPALEGATVLDLGCGTGRDVFICSKLVGTAGHVMGIDMTEQQLAFARRHEAAQMRRFGFERSNVVFYQGYIEDLASIGIADSSIDVLISNCVINLSPFKEQVFEEIFRVLKPGGELYFSDIFSDRRVQPEFYDDPVLRGECLSGALYIEDFRRILAKNGCAASYSVESAPLEIGDFQIATKLGCVGFTSHTIRAIKCSDFEDREENYGQLATYLGTMPENKRYFDASEELRLIAGKPVAISGNMATMLKVSRYAQHFDILGGQEKHLGPYEYQSTQEALGLRLKKERLGLRDLVSACDALAIEPFDQRVHDKELLKSAPALSTMQVNVGYRCNLTCSHCFLECGPARTECMSKETMADVLKAFETGGFKTLDITGGSPEMNPHLTWFIEKARPLAKEIIVRSNLTILDQPEYQGLMQVYASSKVKIATSLPYFKENECDSQRGRHVFDRIIGVLRKMNALGYGVEPELKIDLVYNVSGPFLPPDQHELEDFYTYELEREQQVKFNKLYAFNNYPLGRFAHELKYEGKFDYYLKLLSKNYNGAVVAHMMCRSQINVDYDGRLYDCEVNHVLGLPLIGPQNVRDITEVPLEIRPIATNPICYSCAAGSGSSCGGSLMEKYTHSLDS